MLYFAYGSNLWRQQMFSRCPECREIGAGRLDGWRWIITTRGYASIVVSTGDYVLGTVYELSEGDERNLDGFEGVSQGSYTKEILTIELNGQSASCLTYVDPVTVEGESKVEYIDRINNGIRDAGLNSDYVSHYLRPFIPASRPSDGLHLAAD